jgi:hypothetical protein
MPNHVLASKCNQRTKCAAKKQKKVGLYFHYPTFVPTFAIIKTNSLPLNDSSLLPTEKTAQR